MKIYCAIAALLLISGCAVNDFYRNFQAADGVTEDDKREQFMSQSTSYGFIGTGAEQKERAAKQAQEYCAKQGKTFKHLADLLVDDAIWLGHPAEALILFDCPDN